MRAYLAISVAVLCLLSAGVAAADAAKNAVLYKLANCECCEGYADHLRQAGFTVTVVEVDDLAPIKAQYSVPAHLEGCHTTLTGGYVVEGHVPAAIVQRLLDEHPAIPGISLAGMPLGSPGMGGEKSAPFVVHVLDGQTAAVYAVD